jgi:hypothetical protein
MAAYLEACIEKADGDAAFVTKALGDIARAKGMSQVAPGCRLISRKSLQGILWGKKPRLRYNSQSDKRTWFEITRRSITRYQINGPTIAFSEPPNAPADAETVGRRN